MAFQDFTKSSDNILMQLIKQDNPVTASSLDETKVVFGVPSIVSNGDRNSTIKATPIDGIGIKGTVDVLYNRIDIGTIPGARSKEFVKGDATKLSDIVPQLNERYKINLQEGDYTDVDLTAFDPSKPNQSQDVQLIVVTENKCFINRLVFQVVSGDIDLSELIVNNVLNGLTYDPDYPPAVPT
jgi:hypothetical protein